MARDQTHMPYRRSTLAKCHPTLREWILKRATPNCYECGGTGIAPPFLTSIATVCWCVKENHADIERQVTAMLVSTMKQAEALEDGGKIVLTKEQEELLRKL